jgi:hypothetical protein
MRFKSVTLLYNLCSQEARVLRCLIFRTFRDVLRCCFHGELLYWRRVGRPHRDFPLAEEYEDVIG